MGRSRPGDKLLVVITIFRNSSNITLNICSNMVKGTLAPVEFKSGVDG
jgi:hypothetical protein